MASQINTFDSLEVWRQKINPYLQTISNVTKDSIRFQNQTTGSTSTDGFLIGLDGSDGRVWNHENAIIKFGTSDVERMRIDGSGNVGIGTETPYRALHVVGSIRASATSATDQGQLETSSVLGTSTLTARTYSDAVTGTLFGQVMANWSALFSTGTASNGLIVGTQTGKPLVFGTSAVERMRLDSSGRLLIGTASVLGSETLRVYNASNSRVVIDHASSGLILGSDASGPFIDTTTATRLVVFVGGTERMRIDPTGNLGLGVTPSDWGECW